MKEKWNQNKLSIILLTFNSLLFILFLVYAIIGKEEIRENGKLVLLPLVPVDPRSMFQGDYMILNYDWSKFESTSNVKKFRRGFLLFEIESGVIKPIRLSHEAVDSHNGLYSIKYFRSDYDFKIGAESYFFQEGQADLYSSAKFAGIKFLPNSTSGDKLLVGLYDESKSLIQPKLE
ncbi:MAG: GDYXXLXY domain-containing protein [Leptospira sp.]|nr:GDYXXLXY domain-containing protein [Leptospira sp.]NCS95049.1 GDYXXLXY domain-containing protein [Leptospira sp.]